MAKKLPPEPTIESPSTPPPSEWQPPDGCIVLETREYFAYLDGTRYEHVSDAPDGRWVFRPS